ncbi:uncharacterized protein LOC111491017 [Cucurbita maxima]|uniref:Uncharacterized protein LOC111491017 n=1 Tax=Cucurbita maxima TaxID=3661 RepID=A0A6J1K458_CUCMA|nr:uncharacterized protein LOC111491017 [Cucurbita maxima]XP_022995509.1 uncharacterized protein LOC111491017 [Cucurbita maxima]
MAPCSFPDVYSWIQNLPPLSKWKTTSISTSICSSSSSNSSLNVVAAKSLHSATITLSVIADFSLPISLWSSEPLKTSTKSSNLLDDQESISSLLLNCIRDVLHYGSDQQKNFSFGFLKLNITFNPKEIFNVTFLNLLFLICIYEAPTGLRLDCLTTLKYHLTNFQSRQASKMLMKLLGSNIEEQWMRSINLAITNWIVELKANSCMLKTPSPLFSCSFSTHGSWKVQLYCPVIAMDRIENSRNPSTNERLQLSLNYHQLEGVLQFNYKAEVREKWINLRVHVDNIRCNIIPLVNDMLLSKRGVGGSEKYFPSRISLQLTPTLQTNIMSVSVSKSSDNPIIEVGTKKTLEAGFEPSNPYPGLKLAVGETVTASLKPWKFEQSVYGNTGILNWYLHDSSDGKEVASRKPSKLALINPRAWFRDRYSSAFRPFNRQGGVIFAGDECGESVWWKIDGTARRKTLEWEIRGWIWLTYWPNKHKTFYNETRRLEFKEMLHISIP